MKASASNLFSLGVLALALGHAARAEELQLGEIAVQASAPAVPRNLPATTEGVTAQQITESMNAVTAGETLNYLPSVHVRERYIGDVNGVLVMRVNSSVQSAQTTVYADGLLLSNFLNNSFSTAPRWGMVSPAEIDRIDVIYGPFSALYPGNSAAGVVLMKTRMPERFEAHAGLDLFQQHYKEYATDSTFNGKHATAALGNKTGDWSFWLSADYLDNLGQPMTYTAAAAKAGAPAAAGQFTAVTGAVSDIDTANNPRVITSSAGIDRTTQGIGKIKLAYDISPTLRAAYTLGIWQNTSDKYGETYLRDAGGNPAYGTTTAAGPYRYLRINGQDYTVAPPPSSNQQASYSMHGLSLKSSTGKTWDWEINASLYNQDKDITRTSSGNNGTTPASNATAGTIAYNSGTGWLNLDLRGDWRPDGNLASRQQWSFGYHTDRYILQSDTFNLAAGNNWRSANASSLNASSRGQTETGALYLQDSVQISPALKLVAGARAESWKASNGGNCTGGTDTAACTYTAYLTSSGSAVSPKLSLSWQANPDWMLRGSYGKGTRFPTVGELFANVTIRDTAGNNASNAQIAGFPAPYNSARTNNPYLKPETVNSWELVAERALDDGIWRTSLFGEEKRDALINQTDTTTLPGFVITSIQNVDAVSTVGIETVLEKNGLLFRNFDFSGSVTWIPRSTITRNTKNPGLEGTDQPRIPDWRATLSGTWHASDRLSYSVNYRFSGRQHNALYSTAQQRYTDPNPDVYGAVSHYSVVDAKALYRISKQWSAALGVNNIGSFKYYVNPNPYPQRTYFASLKFDY